MPKKKKLSPRIDDGERPDAHMNDGQALDHDALAAMLSSEYPLIDNSLVLAILSDFDASQLDSQLSAIRDQLGILEAALVPDPDDTPLAENGNSLLAESLSDVTSGVDYMDLSIRHGALDDDTPMPTNNGQTKVISSGETSTSSDGAGASTSATSDLGEAEWQSEEDMLRSLFPHIGEEEIREVHAYEPSVSAAIDHLLNLDMLRNVQEVGHWPGEEVISEDETWKDVPKRPSETPMSRSGSNSSVSSTASIRMPPRTQNTAKRKKNTLTIPLVDTLQRRPSPARSSRQTSRRTSPNRYAVLSGPSNNAWDTISSLAAALSDLLPYGPAYFLTYFHSPDYHHPYDALRAALSGMPSKHDEIDVHAEQILQDIYLPDPDLEDSVQRATKADLEICGSAAGSDVATVMDLMDLLAEVSTWAGDEDAFGRVDDIPPVILSQRSTPLLAPIPIVPPIVAARAIRDKIEPKSTPLAATKIIPGAQPAPSSASHPTAHDDFGIPSPTPPSPKVKADGRQVHLQNFHKVQHARPRPTRILHPYASHIPSYARGSTPHDPTPGSLYRSAANGGYTIQDCMERAAAERAKQQSAIRDVGRHWSGHLAGGKSVGGAVAGHYALEARSAMDRAKKWELQAARMVVDSQLASNKHTIDLHHMTIPEATTVASEAAERWYAGQKQTFTGHTALARDRQATYNPARSLVIVTGVGRHSAGKRGVLGPAVAAALEEAGWRVERGEAGRGYLSVKGRK